MKRQIIIIPRLAVAILVAAFLVTLGGCRQKPAKPQSRQPLRVGVSENVNSLDPLRITDVGAAFVASAIHSPISVVDQAGNVQPILAEKIEMAKDALSCRIALRSGLKFWNGDPVTAEDLAYSIDRFRKTPHPAQWLVGRIAASGLKVEDSQTLAIHFAEPEPDWPLFVSTQFLSVVKRGTAELPPTALNAEVIGCGAYRPERLAAGDAYEFERNAGFPLASGADRLVVRVIPNPANQIDQIARGALDVIRLRGPALGEVAALGGSGGAPQLRPPFAHLKLQRAPARELLFLSLNFAKLGNRVPEAGRAGLLTALSRALDRDALIAMYLGWASPIRDRISPEPIATAPAPVAPEPTTNAPAPFRAELHAANDADSRRVAGLIQTQARTAGLELNIRPVDLGGLMQGVLARQNEITLLWIEQAVPSTALFWAQFFTPGSPFAVLGQPIDGIDADVRAARSTLDPAARRAAYDAVIAKISGQQNAWLSLCTRDAIYLTTPRVESLGFDSNGNATLGLVKIRGE